MSALLKLHVGDGVHDQHDHDQASPEDVIAAYRADAAVLRRYGHDRDANTIERVVGDVEAGARVHLEWLDDVDAKAYTGRSVEWLRSRYPLWEREGLARTGDDFVRYYRRSALLPRFDDGGRD